MSFEEPSSGAGSPALTLAAGAESLTGCGVEGDFLGSPLPQPIRVKLTQQKMSAGNPCGRSGMAFP